MCFGLCGNREYEKKKLSFILIGIEVGNYCLFLYGRKFCTIAHIYMRMVDDGKTK